MPVRVARDYGGPAYRRVAATVHWRKPMPASAIGRALERRRRLYYRRRKYRSVMGYAGYMGPAPRVYGRRPYRYRYRYRYPGGYRYRYRYYY